MSDTELNQISTNDRIVMRYALRSRQDRLLLSSQMKKAVRIAFKSVQSDFLRDDLDYVDETLTNLSKEHPESILVRHTEIQNGLHDFLQVLEDIRVSSTESMSMSQERKLAKALEKAEEKLRTQITDKLSAKEKRAAEMIKFKDDKYFVLLLNLRRISPAFHDILTQREYQPVQVTENLTEKQIKENLLASVSSDLLQVFRDVDALLYEAESMVSSPEDEYFVEQVTADYYPQIFTSLKKIAHSSADQTQKAAVVSECLQQLQLVQIGLRRIIDTGLADNTQSLKSQTAFLRDKVISAKDLIHMANENRLEPATAAAVQQLRSVYEDKIQGMKEAHEAEIASLLLRYAPHTLSTREKVI